MLLPSGVAYWTVLDSELRVVDTPDEFLRHLRFGRERAESTTESYAGAVALYLRWCGESGRAWTTGARHLGMFMVWLKYAPQQPTSAPVVPRQGTKQVRGPRRVNVVLAAVREYLKYAVSIGSAPTWVIDQLYEVGDGRDLPTEVRGEYGVPTRLREGPPSPSRAGRAGRPGHR
ncbi:hypothetical protein ACFP51_24390 [Streptomyces pratens]|uniref:Core-binding (CB) domain-containing protein n=1 Tax=Streptomyces pratens TaxID=887456 RepID=A0ABW1LYW8_9ACTN